MYTREESVTRDFASHLLDPQDAEEEKLFELAEAVYTLHTSIRTIQRLKGDDYVRKLLDSSPLPF